MYVFTVKYVKLPVKEFCFLLLLFLLLKIAYYKILYRVMYIIYETRIKVTLVRKRLAESASLIRNYSAVH